MAEKTLSRYLDTLGTVASSACAVHCLLTPLVLGLLPLLGLGFLAADWFENTAVAAAIVLGVTSLVHGYAHHRQFHALRWLLLGIALLVSGRWLVSGDSQTWEAVLVVCGGLAVAWAHWTNRRLCQVCETCHGSH